MNSEYVHGYDRRESERLRDQAFTLAGLLHSDTLYPAGSSVLEAGCGVGAQTVTIAKNNPDTQFTSFDISKNSVAEAATKVATAGLANVRCMRGDIFDLPFASGSFDHILVCFVLEHLSRPAEALRRLGHCLRTGGTMTVIEGDHGSAFFHPDSMAAQKVIQCQIELQRRAGGNALIGRELRPLLCGAGYGQVEVSPRMVYVDSGRPELVNGFTKKTFTAMIEGIGGAAVSAGIISQAAFEEGIRGLYRTAEEDGVFCYTFFKATGRKQHSRTASP